MASIVERGNSISVVYRHEGVQIWESVPTRAAARKRKKQIEYFQEEGQFKPPSPKTVSDLLSDFVMIYGAKKWKGKGYTSKCGLINNYINPELGELLVEKVNKRTIDDFYTKLLKTPSVKQRKGVKPDELELVSPRNVFEIHKVLKCAFNQAIGWEIIDKNPILRATVPEVGDSAERPIWNIDTLLHAMNVCDNLTLEVAMHLALCISGREGEILGLQWDRVDVSIEAIEANEAYAYIDRGLERVRKDALKATDNRGLLFTFPALFAGNTSDLVLMSPKTKKSRRKVWLPRTVAYKLRELKEWQEEMQALYETEYTDFGLVISQSNGRPIEQRVLLKHFKKLIAEHELPPVVFHSLRALSSTYKLKLNNGDIKATQGDTGHSTAKILLDTYAKILDEDRKNNAIKMEQQIYQRSKNQPEGSSSDKVLEIIKTNPALAQVAEQFLTALVNAASA